MPLNSFKFWFIFPVIFGIYWGIPKKYNIARKVFLILVSYCLYMNWKPTFAIVLFFVSLISYLGGIIISKEYTETRKRKTIISIFSIITLFPLLFFKYYNFIKDTINYGLCKVGLKLSLPGLNWAIPIGISFFTFQALGYLLDVYHKRITTEKNIVDYLLFVSFFPQVMSGPISQPRELLPQMKEDHSFDYELAKEGLKLLIWGMFLKVVIADRLGMYVNLVYANYKLTSGANCLMASILYSLQIYGDFAGYSYMAIGIAQTLGFILPENFRRPYFAVSITEFWSRWHISLTRWLTYHVYIPLGGNRCAKWHCYINIMITFLVSGIWHGANWTFIIWGIIHGITQIIEKALGISHVENKNLFIKLIRIVFIFLIVNFAWIFFRMQTIRDAIEFIMRILLHFGKFDILSIGTTHLAIIIVTLPIVLVKDFIDERHSKQKIVYGNKIVTWCFYLYLAFCILGLGVLDSSQFIYVSF